MPTLRIAAVAAFAVAFFAVSAHAQAPANNDGLKNILAPGATLEKVAGGFGFTEGPLYDRKTNSVLFSDQRKHVIDRYDCATGKVSVFREVREPNGNTYDAEGRLVGCEHGARRVSRTEADGRIVTLAYLYNGKRLSSPNDLVIKKNGVIYFTDPPYGLNGQPKEQDVNGVYAIQKDGSVTLLTGELRMPNGLAFSPDEKILYVDDTEQQIIRAYDMQPDGTIANGRTLVDMHRSGHRGAPDGMKVDNNGIIFSTGSGGIWVIAPSGTVLGIIDTPEVGANCAFGDKDGKSLYITASTGLYRIRLQNPGPIPGKK